MAKDSLKAKFDLTRSQLDLLIASLNDVIRQAKAGEILSEKGGICRQWSMAIVARKPGIELKFNHPDLATRDVILPRDVFSSVVALVRFIAQDWEHSREPGCPCPWPVPRTYVRRIICEDTWAGEQLKLRLSLMRHITKRLRDWRRHTTPGGILQDEIRKHFKLPKDHLGRLIQSLEKLKEEGPSLSYTGICGNWTDAHEDMFRMFPQDLEKLPHISRRMPTYALVDYLARSWPLTLRPEGTAWPVPEVPHHGTWKGKNLELRMSLIDHMLKILRSWQLA